MVGCREPLREGTLQFRGGGERQLVCVDIDSDRALKAPQGLKVEEASPECAVDFL